MPKSPWILIAFTFFREAKPTLPIELFCIIISWFYSDIHWDNSHYVGIIESASLSTWLRNSNHRNSVTYLESPLPKKKKKKSTKKTNQTKQKTTSTLKGNWTNSIRRLKKVNGNISLAKLSKYQISGMNLPQALITVAFPLRPLHLGWNERQFLLQEELSFYENDTSAQNSIVFIATITNGDKIK